MQQDPNAAGPGMNSLSQEQQQLLMHAQQIEQRSQQMRQQLEVIEEQITSLNQFRETLKQLKENPEAEILSTLGRGVHAPAKLADGKVFIEVGANVAVRKTPEEALEVIADQLKQLQEVRVQTMAEIESLNEEMMNLIQGLRSKSA